MTVKKRKPGSGCSTFTEDVYVEAYRLAKSGLSDTAVADALGCSRGTFKTWRKKYPALRKALAKARLPDKSVETFQEYVYDRLPEHLRAVWDEIQQCQTEPNAIGRIEALLKDQGRRGRQHLFLYALVNSNFDLSEACKCVQIHRRTLDRWVTTDPGFAELLDEIDWHKANFFEGALVALVRAGVPAAVMFANRTFNAKRGYGTTKQVNVSVNGEVNHTHTAVPIDDLNLPLEVRKQMLDKVRERRALEAPRQVELS